MSILNPNLRGFFEQDAHNYVLYGGRASSKTYHTAAFCVFLAINYKVRFLCVRQFQARISDSVKSVIESRIDELGLRNEFRITDNEIEHLTTGATFTFLGILRNLREIKGIAGIDVLWIEEAEDLSEEQWKVLEPTVREEHSRIIIVFNPRHATDFVYRKFVIGPRPPKTVVRKINYDENPFLSSRMREIIEAVKKTDRDDYDHIYGGEPLSDSDDVVIKRAWLLAAVGAHTELGIEPLGDKRIGFDIADSGADKCANVFAHGQLASWSDQWKAQEDQLLMSCTRTWNVASERGASVIYDSIGVGASAGAKFAELNAAPGNHDRRVRYEKFNAGDAVFKPEAIYEPSRAGGQAGVKNKDMFLNLKAQAWWGVADRLKATYNAVRNGEKVRDPAGLMFLDPAMPNLDKLIDELATPKRDFDSSGGRVKVESKKDLMKREVPSPNLADALVMAFAPRSAGIRITPDLLARI